MTLLTIRAANFRVLSQLEWTPSGVCLLAGSNGSGKTTTLDAMAFLRGVFLYGHEAAFNSTSGSYFRRLETPEQEPVTFELEIDDIRWRLRFPMTMSGLRGQYGEELYRGDELILRAGMFEEGWYLHDQRMKIDRRRCCARILWDRGSDEWMMPLEHALSNMRIHDSSQIHHVRNHEPTTGLDSHLHGTGKNLWSVLSNWKQAPIRHQGKFDWVIKEAQCAFPDIMGSIEFDRGLPFLYGPNDSDPADGLPPTRMADGLLTGLVHLTAIAGAHEGAIIAFDEIENQLHPHAIRSILTAMRQKAEERDLTVIMTTHSPVVMNEFKGYEDQFYILAPSDTGPTPRPLDELHDPDWLAHFTLGDLYERAEIAAPLSLAKDPPQ